eukprot:600410-Pleurochrysis_carterae.AAC.1
MPFLARNMLHVSLRARARRTSLRSQAPKTRTIAHMRGQSRTPATPGAFGRWFPSSRTSCS